MQVSLAVRVVITSNLSYSLPLSLAVCTDTNPGAPCLSEFQLCDGQVDNPDESDEETYCHTGWQ